MEIEKRGGNRIGTREGRLRGIEGGDREGGVIE